MAAVLLAAVVIVSAVPAGASTTHVEVRTGAGAAKAPSVPAFQKGPDSLQLLSQSAWAGPGKDDFQLRLKVTASDAVAESLAVVVYGELLTRSQFQAALAGNDLPPIIYDPNVPLATVPAAPGGGLLVDIPVGRSGGLTLSSTGVYPVQVFLEKDGSRVGSALTSFLVYAGPDAAHLKKLNVGLVVPFSAGVPVSQTGVPGPVSQAALPVLKADSHALATYRPTEQPPYGAPVTVDANVATLEALARGRGAERVVLARLAEAAQAGDEILPATALPVDPASMLRAGLASWLGAEVSSGTSELTALLGSQPDETTWAFPGGVDEATAAEAEAMGARRVVVPEAELSPLPPSLPDQQLTFALPTELSVAGAEPLEVIGADTELSTRAGQSGRGSQAVLVANQLLAELAMIDLEQPGNTRGVVIMPPSSSQPGPGFLSVLLSGLEGNPLLSPSTLSGIFKLLAVPTLPGGARLGRHLTNAGYQAPLPGAAGVAAASRDLKVAGQVFGSGSTVLRNLSQELFASLSSVFTTGEREEMVGEVASTSRSLLSKVRLPPPSSITLTSLRGRLPLSLLSVPGAAVHVRLVLASEQLSFQPASSPLGDCRPLGPSSEGCQLLLSGATTDLEVPVAVRTPGTFQLSLSLESPDGAVRLSSSTDTVRSLVAPGLGLALMIGAALFLLVWWVRNARHGRRARRLVPRPLPGDDPPAGEGALVAESKGEEIDMAGL